MIEIHLKKRLKFSSGDAMMEIDNDFSPKEFLAIYGASGAGKTTLLRLIAGFTEADEGSIKVNGVTWFDRRKRINLSPQKRKVGFVFQDYALFPNMTVKENIAFAQPQKDNIMLDEIIQVLSLGTLVNRKPETLSGGQKQRTALARAIARKPEILLLDEPLSALDTENRLELQNELSSIHKKMNLSTLMVSHDLAEIAKLANKVLVIEAGRIVKEGDPLSVFVEKKVSGKVKFVGEVLDIKKEDVVYILTIVSGNSIIKVIGTKEDVQNLSIGNKVMIASKAFNPIIIKL